MTIKAAAPSQMTSNEKAEFIAFVSDAGEVSLGTLPALVDQSLVLVTTHEDEQIIGTAAIKRPHDRHRKDEFAKAGAEDLSLGFPLELGWVVVRPDRRKNGNGGALVEAAAKAAPTEGVYATTKTKGMKRILSGLGFERLGKEYPSALNPAANLSLFVRP